MTDHNELVEKVALAMSKVEWCGAKVGDELCLCDDPRLPNDARQVECLCRKQAPAAIDMVLEEAAKVCISVSTDALTKVGREHEPYMRATAEDCAAAIRALKDKPTA